MRETHGRGLHKEFLKGPSETEAYRAFKAHFKNLEKNSMRGELRSSRHKVISSTLYLYKIHVTHVAVEVNG